MAMGTVSDDEISLTSTIESDQQSEYEVKTILSEDLFEDGTRYLVEWAGYPIERCTWEPADAFGDDETLRDWKRKKRLIEDGKLEAFDVASWEARIIQLNEEREQRRQRRAAKRERNIALSGSSHGSQAVPSKQRPEASSASIPPLNTTPNSAAPRPVNPPRQGLAARKLPPVLFGTSQKAPMTSRPKKTPSTDTHKTYTLSWKHKFEKRAQRDRVPDINQLELRRPSDWATARSAGAIQFSSSRRGPVQVETSNASPTDTDRPGSLLNSPILPQHIQESPASSPRSNDATRENSKPGSSDKIHPSRRAFVPTAPSDSRIMDHGALPEMPPRIPGSKARFVKSTRGRFWNFGEFYVSLYFGQDKQDIGNARLCGIDTRYAKKILSTKVGDKIEIWFRYLCTLDEYQQLCERVSS
jgi:chromo domain-containing protein 1